jgi:hypothetical protein
LLRGQALQQLFGDEAAKVARRSCDDDAREISGGLNATFLTEHATEPESVTGPNRGDGSTRTKG